jgi:hypothetical protein
LPAWSRDAERCAEAPPASQQADDLEGPIEAAKRRGAPTLLRGGEAE